MARSIRPTVRSCRRINGCNVTAKRPGNASSLLKSNSIPTTCSPQVPGFSRDVRSFRQSISTNGPTSHACRGSSVVQVFGRRDDETDHALKGPATKKRQGTKSRAVGQWLAASAMGIACRRCSRWWARPQHRTTCMSACRGAQESAMGISAGTRSASTGGRWIDGRHRVERRQPASQNTSTTFAFRHECCARGDLMFSAYVISNSCAWQK